MTTIHAGDHETDCDICKLNCGCDMCSQEFGEEFFSKYYEE